MTYERKKRKLDLQVFIPGFLLTMFGVRLIIFTEIGASPVDTFVVGLYENFGLTLGTWANIAALSALALSGFFNKKLPNILSIVLSIGIGLALDFYTLILFRFFDLTQFSLPVLIAFFFFGIALMGLGISMQIMPQIGMSGLDALTNSISLRFKISLALSRFIIDLAFAILGFLAGGPFGIGTLVLLLFTGTFIGFFNKYVVAGYTKRLNKLKEEFNITE